MKAQKIKKSIFNHMKPPVRLLEEFKDKVQKELQRRGLGWGGNVKRHPPTPTPKKKKRNKFNILFLCLPGKSLQIPKKDLRVQRILKLKCQEKRSHAKQKIKRCASHLALL